MPERIGKAAEIVLGKAIERTRLMQQMSQLALGRKTNQKQQQIAKYEAGEFVPLPVLEAIGEALSCPIPKRVIRRISFLRKLEIETEIEQEELIPLYETLFSEDVD